MLAGSLVSPTISSAADEPKPTPIAKGAPAPFEGDLYPVRLSIAMGQRLDYLEQELAATKARAAEILAAQLAAAEERAAAKVAGADARGEAWKNAAEGGWSWMRSPYLWFGIGVVASALFFAVAAYAIHETRWVVGLMP